MIINYFISENYIPNWTIEDAYREILQNFIDYGDYTIEKTSNTNNDIIYLRNNFNPENEDLFLIGESTKDTNKIGKYGEGLKMAALVLLRNGLSCAINTARYRANFVLIDNEHTKHKTLGVELYYKEVPTDTKFFEVRFKSFPNTFDNYYDNVIKPQDVIHHREGYGSIVNRDKGNIYVGNLFVCNISKLNYAYNFYPKVVPLDRDRKVPQDFDIMWNTGKIQETYEKRDVTGLTTDTYYSNLPTNVDRYKPFIKDDKIQFKTEIVEPDGEKKEVIVSSDMTMKLKNHTFFEKSIFKLKAFIAKSIGIPELALQFRNKYLTGEAVKDFNILMLRLGVELPMEIDELPF